VLGIQTAAAHGDLPITPGCKVAVMGHKDHGCVVGFSGLEQKLKDLGRSVGVKITRGLVAQQDFGAFDKGPRQRHTLALAAGKPQRCVVPAPF
jgi:hypothetical protein